MDTTLAEAIKYACPQCDSTIELGDIFTQKGTRITCPYCSTVTSRDKLKVTFNPTDMALPTRWLTCPACGDFQGINAAAANRYVSTKCASCGVRSSSSVILTLAKKEKTPMSSSTEIVAWMGSSHGSLEPSKEKRFIISSLKTMKEGSYFKFAPNKLYETVEDASRAAQQYLKMDQPMYILAVVKKIELAPPPTVETNFDG